MGTMLRGAEAVVMLGNGVAVKKRISKGYRQKELDSGLRTSRTMRETKAMEAASALGIRVPRIIDSDRGAKTIRMEMIIGTKVRDILNSRNCARICTKIGNDVAVMHNNGLIHGDLTTSNMIIEKGTGYLHFIDFGLSQFSNKDEDKAVDIHLFRQALESKHHSIWGKGYASFLIGYKERSKDSLTVMDRLEQVESRGRNKKKCVCSA